MTLLIPKGPKGHMRAGEHPWSLRLWLSDADSQPAATLPATALTLFLKKSLNEWVFLRQILQ